MNKRKVMVIEMAVAISSMLIAINPLMGYAEESIDVEQSLEENLSPDEVGFVSTEANIIGSVIEEDSVVEPDGQEELSNTRGPLEETLGNDGILIGETETEEKEVQNADDEEDEDYEERIYGDYEYYIDKDSNTVTITQYMGHDKNVLIPAEIEGLQVTNITGVFMEQTSIEQVTIPSSVTEIGYAAFYGCTSLKEITIPNSVTSIGADAFCDCISLKQVVIPNSVTNIWDYAFFNCTSLEAVYFNGDAPAIGNESFPYSDSLILYVPNGKSGWSVPEWSGWHVSYLVDPNMGWPIVNDGGFSIETTSSGIGLTLRDLQIKKGVCFGLSALSALCYDGLVDIQGMTGKPGKTLSEYGYNSTRKLSNGKLAYTITDRKLQNLIVHYQFAQFSMAARNSRIIKDRTLSVNTIKEIEREAKNQPIVVGMESPINHAVVIPQGAVAKYDNDVDGYYFELYDCNAPQVPESLRGKNTLGINYNHPNSLLVFYPSYQTFRYLFYDPSIDLSTKRVIGYDSKDSKELGKWGSIYFYNMFSFNYFKQLQDKFSNTVKTIILVTVPNCTIMDVEGNVLAKLDNGVASITGKGVELNSYCAGTGVEGNDVSCFTLNRGDYIVDTLDSGTVIKTSNDDNYLTSVKTDGKSHIKISDDDQVELRALGSVNIVIKTLANDGNFIKTEGVLNKGEMVKLIKKEGSIEVKTDAKAGNINSSKIDSNNNIVSTVTVYIEKGMQSIHTHAFTAWTTSSPATVFTPEVQTRTCSCGQKETRAVGSKLAPTIRLNAGSIVLKRKQRTNKLKVSGLAAGDSVKSWKSSNSKIVKVNGKGVVTAGTKAGKAKLTVTLASGFKKTIAVKVQKNAVAAGKITGLPKKLTLKKGMKVQLKPAVQPITCVAKVRYKSSNGKAVKVSGKGYVTAKKKGKSTITVQCGRKKAKIKVTVK